MPSDDTSILESLVSSLRVDQREQWRSGRRLVVERYFERHPELLEAHDQRLDLIYSEYCVRKELGEAIRPEEFYQRFPMLVEDLKPLFEIDQALDPEPTAGESHENRTPTDDLRRFGRFRTGETLAAGETTVTYTGFDDEDNRRVVIKVTHSNHPDADVARFTKLAYTLQALAEPLIVPILKVGRTHGGLVYIVSKFIDGDDLDSLLRQKRTCEMPPASEERPFSWMAERLARQRFSRAKSILLVARLARALHGAHSVGQLHANIKPSNIVIDKDENPYWTDFRPRHLRTQEYVQASPNDGASYFSPEQARGEWDRLDARSDIFSVGVLLYEVLVGRRPFRTKTALDLRDRIANADARNLRALNRSTPDVLARIVRKCLAKRPDERYVDARTVAEDLEGQLHEARATAQSVANPATDRSR